MKKKYENLIVGLMALGIFAILLSIPSILTSLPLWVTGLIGISFVFLWLFVGVGQFTEYFVDIYKSDGFKGIKKEIIFWLPPLYFLGCLVLIFYGAWNGTILGNLGIVGVAIGVVYVLVRDQKMGSKK